MSPSVDLDTVTPIDTVAGDTPEETAALKGMVSRAAIYLTSFRWCPPIVETYLGYGVADVVALCLFRVAGPVGGTDEWFWVVDGDLPSAYFVVEQAPSPPLALRVYCDLMDEWANAVLAHSSLMDVFPVKAEPTTDNAQALISRTRFLRETIIPRISI
jgi:hypothetical protein